MASANDEETSLHHEERRLGLEIQRVELEERTAKNLACFLNYPGDRTV